MNINFETFITNFNLQRKKNLYQGDFIRYIDIIDLTYKLSYSTDLKVAKKEDRVNFKILSADLSSRVLNLFLQNLLNKKS